MEHILPFLRASFLIFIAYTCIYMVHWLLGMVISVNRLSDFEENKLRAGRILGDAQAREIPVSVIIPAYNEQACICDTVETLLEADYPALEIIVVNDGSADNTEQCLRQRFSMRRLRPVRRGELPTKPIRSCFGAELRGKQLLLVNKDNGGKGDALNCGFNLSGGRCCVVVDADTRVHPDAIRMLAARFYTDRRTVVCAGAVGTQAEHSRRLSPLGKLLVLFQRMEYYRTFYVHRIMYDRLNANIIVSGAFAMFDRELVLEAGGYRTDTIGEDMELTMRLHAFCLSQKREYAIAYVPEARCDTQVPYCYRDYFRQRRRWHIGLTQSLGAHFYMIGHRFYGWVGTLAVLFTLVYEFLSPFIEVAGMVILILAAFAGIFNAASAAAVIGAYLVLSLLTQLLLLAALRIYRVEALSLPSMLCLLLAASTEWLVFHPINIIVKLVTFLTYRKYRQTWSHIRRIREMTRS